jgi:hypothetical protein
VAIAEPVPLVATESLGIDPVLNWIEHWSQLKTSRRDLCYLVSR